MAEVLDQHEVDALLAAVNAGGMDTLPDDMVSASRNAGTARVRTDVRSYDFKRPERVSKEQMRALESLHETFARNFGASLSGYMRTIVDIRVATIEQLTYSEFIHSLPNPTNFNLLRVDPLEGQMCLELSPLIIYPIIDRLLGGSNSDLFIPQRPLTSIEARLVKKITDRAVNSLTEVWSEMIEVTFSITEVESNPHLVQIVAPNDVVVVVGFELKMAGRSGTMSLCIPFNTIEPIIGRLVSQGWLAYQRKSAVDDRKADIARGIGATAVEVVVYLAETKLKMGELMNLQPGDILTTNKDCNSELVLQVEGMNKFAGKPGRHKDKVALQVTRRAEVEEPM